MSMVPRNMKHSGFPEEEGETKVGLRELDHISRKLYIFFVTSHNFFSLSSVQIIIIPACCLLCVL